MVSIDALFEVLEAIHEGGGQLILERRGGEYLALDGNAHSIRAAGSTPTEALVSLAARIQDLTAGNAERLEVAAKAAVVQADTAKRLAIQAKRVVDGFAQGASE